MDAAEFLSVSRHNTLKKHCTWKARILIKSPFRISLEVC